MIDKVREVALKVLYKIDKDEAFSNIALNEAIKENRNWLDQRDIGLISEIVYGTLTWRLTIDEIIMKYSKIRLKKISTWILNILRMGVYQIVFLDKIPKSAAVNECVNLAKRYGHKSSSNFVNAILRKVSIDDYKEFYNIENDVQRISKTTSMPIWIVEKLLEEIDIDKVEEICECSNLHPNLTVRINKLKTNLNDFKNLMNNENIDVENGVLEDFFILKNVKSKSIDNLDLFKKGYFTVQDEGAGLIPLILEPKENDYILDACSSPGGKTTYIAELMNNKGKIDAWDLYDNRVNLVNSAAKRLNIDIIQAQKQDATMFREDLIDRYDKILLDVPCLGLGVLKRKPDIKWQRKEDDIKNISEIQYKILETCSKYLKSGGILVYSTCSILKSENEDIIKKFLKNNKAFTYKEIQSKIYNKICQNETEKCNFIRLYPNKNNDGFFICKMQKK